MYMMDSFYVTIHVLLVLLQMPNRYIPELYLWETMVMVMIMGDLF